MFTKMKGHFGDHTVSSRYRFRKVNTSAETSPVGKRHIQGRDRKGT